MHIQDFLNRKSFFRSVIITCIVLGISIPFFEYLHSRISNEPYDIKFFFISFIFTIIISAAITSANLIVFKYYHQKYPYKKLFAKRIIFELSGTAIIASTVISILYLPLKWMVDCTGITYNKIEYSYLNLLLGVNGVNLVASLFFETYFLFIQWRELLIESERMKRETAESQYLALKNQVNPHFLFNNLNSLSSLIRLSPDKAIEFVDKFSKIYRYVLDMSDKMVVKLQEELSFLNSYYFLQKIRFGDNLTININIEAERLNDFVLPLSLQILIENVIKHNEVSSEYPMVIELKTDRDFLIVSNNLQKKSNIAESTGIGLTNIKDRYFHLTNIQPEFSVIGKQYVAKIPLIKEA
jgi:two-component system, LytTR family, sensor kinase